MEVSNYIGLICNVTSQPQIEDGIRPWMHRALAIQPELVKQGHAFFCYNPDEIDPVTHTVRGFILKDLAFHEVILPIPALNYQTSYYMGLFEDTYIESLPFQAWALKHGYEFYPYNSINRLLIDKLAIAETLNEFNPAIQPKTEVFTWKIPQLKKFTSQFNCVFIKPRFGSWGDDIFVIKRENSAFKINYYRDGEVRSEIFDDFEDLRDYIDNKSQANNYLIQQGVDVLRVNDYVFDVRTVVIKNEKDWFVISQVRQGAKSKEVSNIAQGGQDYNTQSYLEKVFSEKAEQVFNEIEKLSKDIADHLVKRHHAKIEQFAVDILVDKTGNLFISELNSDPILLGSPKNFGDFFKMTPEEKLLYTTTTLKHGEYLAKSMLKTKAKLKKRENKLELEF